ncbi:uracil-DNA glycosylase family protein [uncultured Sphaerochaeta sp.]|uniref:uracil-DNA glycosylase family protein n=1 Tax=uncultured Sphaerochaeta sp. TaxID=886478 RepID=UPI002A0A2DA5|nr:uracil-DNA glycosylase family protein [uncultured Sphaerochaeta sp.]
MLDFAEKVRNRTLLLRSQVESLRFSQDYIVYDPLDYAWELHEQYILRYQGHPVEAIFLGMNPGPFGMAQTGIPFGEINAVRSFLKIEGNVGKPSFEHPKRPILGMDIQRSEISGKRLWSLFSDHYGSAERCFSQIAVLNYCPLVFMDRGPTGKNITPDKLPKIERFALETICDSYLFDLVAILEPTYLIGIGNYAKAKLEKIAESQKRGFSINSILHPSPGNPMANKGWAEKTESRLIDIGLW